MINSAESIIDQGKKSLETLLREKAYEEVREVLNEQGIAIESVSDTDVEALVAERVKEKRDGMKNMAIGGAFALLLSSVIGF